MRVGWSEPGIVLGTVGGLQLHLLGLGKELLLLRFFNELLWALLMSYELTSAKMFSMRDWAMGWFFR